MPDAPQPRQFIRKVFDERDLDIDRIVPVLLREAPPGFYVVDGRPDGSASNPTAESALSALVPAMGGGTVQVWDGGCGEISEQSVRSVLASDHSWAWRVCDPCRIPDASDEWRTVERMKKHMLVAGSVTKLLARRFIREVFAEAGVELPAAPVLLRDAPPGVYVVDCRPDGESRPDTGAALTALVPKPGDGAVQTWEGVSCEVPADAPLKSSNAWAWHVCNPSRIKLPSRHLNTATRVKEHIIAAREIEEGMTGAEATWVHDLFAHIGIPVPPRTCVGDAVKMSGVFVLPAMQGILQVTDPSKQVRLWRGLQGIGKMQSADYVIGLHGKHAAAYLLCPTLETTRDTMETTKLRARYVYAAYAERLLRECLPDDPPREWDVTVDLRGAPRGAYVFHAQTGDRTLSLAWVSEPGRGWTAANGENMSGGPIALPAVQAWRVCDVPAGSIICEDRTTAGRVRTLRKATAAKPGPESRATIATSKWLRAAAAWTSAPLDVSTTAAEVLSWINGGFSGTPSGWCPRVCMYAHDFANWSWGPFDGTLSLTVDDDSVVSPLRIRIAALEAATAAATASSLHDVDHLLAEWTGEHAKRGSIAAGSPPPSAGGVGAMGEMLWPRHEADAWAPQMSTAWLVRSLADAPDRRVSADGRSWARETRPFVVGRVSDVRHIRAWRAAVVADLARVGVPAVIPDMMPIVSSVTPLDSAPAKA